VFAYHLIMELRPYQTQLIKEARKQMLAGNRSILIQSPTGSGKTILTAHMFKTCESKKMKSVFVVHRRELIKQSILAFSSIGIKAGVIASDFPMNNKALTQIASIQTLIRRLKYFRKFDMIVFDEAHHASAGSWRKLINHYPGAYRIGLTATPERLDGTGLASIFDTMILGPSVQWLIDNGHLAQYKLFAPSKINTSGLHTRMGDFIASEVESLVDRPTVTGDAIKHYREICPGKRAVVFAASIRHSQHIVEQFNQARIPAAHVDGETPKFQRDKIICDFKAGKILILSNVNLFGEGFDLPTLEATIMLRPTQSLGLYLQMIGRCLRPSPGKEHAIILDHAGNVERHGLPCEDRVWSLEATRRSKRIDKNNTVKIRTCEKCYAVQPAGGTHCTLCGFEFEKKEREINFVEGKLIEVDYKAIRNKRMKEQSQCQSEEALVELGKKRGYKRPRLWARHILRVRRDKHGKKN
jgi:DNA repair protein RadD